MNVPPESTSNTPGAAGAALLSTQDLLQHARLGERGALEALFARYRPRLERWAAGRLPMHARSLLDTSDLVQETLLKALGAIGAEGSFELRRPGGFEAYVRRAVLNRIRDQVRWARRRAGSGEVSEMLADPAPSPLEHAIGAEVLQRYEAAMDQLSDDERQLVHLRVELDLDYEEITLLTGRPSPNATRVAFQRCMRKVAEAMGRVAAKQRGA